MLTNGLVGRQFRLHRHLGIHRDCHSPWIGGLARRLQVGEAPRRAGLPQIDHLIEMDIAKRFDAQDRKLDQIQREATPNGGNSTRLGDTVKRTEGKVDGIVTTLDRHIGQSDEVHSEMRRRIGALEKRSS